MRRVTIIFSNNSMNEREREGVEGIYRESQRITQKIQPMKPCRRQKRIVTVEYVD